MQQLDVDSVFGFSLGLKFRLTSGRSAVRERYSPILAPRLGLLSGLANTSLGDSY